MTRKRQYYDAAYKRNAVELAVREVYSVRAAGVPVAAVRRVLREALAEGGQTNVEVFPKQDRLASGEFGNFINLPLFDRLVPEGRTVFVDQAFTPCVRGQSIMPSSAFLSDP